MRVRIRLHQPHIGREASLESRKALRSKISSELLAEHDFNLAALHRA